MFQLQPVQQRIQNNVRIRKSALSHGRISTINDYEDYDDDVVLAINDKNYEVVIDSAKNLSDDYVQYDLSELIRHDEQGFIEPDCDATNELANKYFFVR